MCISERVQRYLMHCRHNIYRLPMLGELGNETMDQLPPTANSEDLKSLLAPSTNIGQAVHTTVSLAYHVYGICHSGKRMSVSKKGPWKHCFLLKCNFHSKHCAWRQGYLPISISALIDHDLFFAWPLSRVMTFVLLSLTR